MTAFAKLALVSAVLLLSGVLAEEPPVPEGKKAAPANADEQAEQARQSGAKLRNEYVSKRLRLPVAFEFVDTPLEEAVASLNKKLTGLKITFDQDAAKGAKTTINLRVTDMSAELALKRIVRLANLDYGIVDGVIVICKPKPAPAEDPRNAETRTKLQRKVTFEFVDTPLDEALSFIRSLANVTIIVDPKLYANGVPTISLRVTDMSLNLALEWILKLADLEYGIEDGALIIDKPNMAKPKPAALPAPEAGAKELLPWVVEMRKKLARKVSFEFVDTPLREVLQFLNSLTKVNIILDPKIVDEGKDKTPITLRVQDMEMEVALKWIVRLAGLKYDFRGQAVFIARDEPAAQPQPAPAPKPKEPSGQF